MYGRGVDTSPEKAIEWLKRAAEQNHAGAYAKLGPFILVRIVFESTGIICIHVQKDPSEAFRMFQESADRHNTLGLYHLGFFPILMNALNSGLCYLKGTGTLVNHIEAVKCFKNASKQNHNGALFQLGTRFLFVFPL